MDTAFDFIQPEFLNILFFQQKSIVIFPYVDIKHLRSLEIFAIGYNILDLDSTALHNIKEVLELEKYNSYSQNPSFFFISNVNEVQLEEIMSLNDVHCVINCNEDLSSFINGDNFIFYNKKNKKFLNFTRGDLEFEESLISSSKNISILQDKILKIRTIATEIYTELNDSGNIRAISKMLAEIDSNYWENVLNYARTYYKIEIPEVAYNPESLNQKNGLIFNSFSDEYDLIVSKNKLIGKEFMQLIHDYRKKKVNSANLDNEQLYYPLKLYDYLRNHHWSKGIDKEFLVEWVQMKKTQYHLDEDDLADFHYVLEKLKVPNNIIVDILDIEIPVIKQNNFNENQEENYLPQENYQIKKSMFEKLHEIENMVDNNRLSPVEVSNLQQDLTTLLYLISSSDSISSNNENKSAKLPQSVKEKVITHLEKLYFRKFLKLHQEIDPFRFIIRFLGFLEHLHKIVFGKDTTKSVPQKIKEFQIPNTLEKEIFLVYNWRKKLAHPELSQKFEITPFMKKKSREVYNDFIVYFYTSKIKEIAQYEGWDLIEYGAKIIYFLTITYFEPLNLQNFFSLNSLVEG